MGPALQRQQRFEEPRRIGVSKNHMKIKLPGILCVKNQYAGGVGYSPRGLRGDRRVVFIMSNGGGGGGEGAAPSPPSSLLLSPLLPPIPAPFSAPPPPPLFPSPPLLNMNTTLPSPLSLSRNPSGDLPPPLAYCFFYARDVDELGFRLGFFFRNAALAEALASFSGFRSFRIVLPL